MAKKIVRPILTYADESHRLSKRKNLTGYKSFDDVSRALDLEPTNGF